MKFDFNAAPCFVVNLCTYKCNIFNRITLDFGFLLCYHKIKLLLCILSNYKNQLCNYNKMTTRF